MKIKSIEPFAASLPMKKPVTMAGETVTRADNVFVRIETDSGVVGWGEAASAPTMTGETTASMMAAIIHMRPGLIGRAADDFPALSAAMNDAMFGNSGAKAAIEMASHDAVARAAGRPLYTLFGDRRRSRIPVLAVIGSTDQAADMREARERWAAGYRAFKIKVGLASPEADAARTQDVCRLLKSQGERVPRVGRCQSGFRRRRSAALCRGVADCGLDFFEQPVRAENLDGMARIAAATEVADRRRRGHPFARRH